MKDRLHRAFSEIRADEALLEKTADFLNGERIKREMRGRRPGVLRFAWAFAAAMVLVIGAVGYNFYFTAASYVSIDVNPSVELTLNRLDRVIGSYAFNAAGERLLQTVGLNGKKYDEAMSLLVTRMGQDGYLSETSLVSVTVQTINGQKEQILCDALLQFVTEGVSAMQTTADIEVFPVSSDIRGNAYGHHMSPAKYLAIQELLGVDETATLEQYSQSGIRQIRQRIHQCRKENGGMGMGGNGGGHGNGQGWGRGRGRRNGYGRQ